MGSLFTTEIGRMRSEEMIGRAARYQALARAQRERDDATPPQPKEPSPVLTSLYRRALKIATVALTVGLVLTGSIALAVPAGPGTDPTGSIQKSVEVTTPVAEGAGGSGLWILAAVALAAGLAALFVWLSRQHSPKTA